MLLCGAYNDTEHYHAATCEHIDEKDALASYTIEASATAIEPGYGLEGLKTSTCPSIEWKRPKLSRHLCYSLCRWIGTFVSGRQ